ncbi:MAG: DUF3857 domain-containing protein [Phenylobacterium sp.]
MLCSILAAAAFAWASSALAADKPLYGPPAAWVDVAPIPPAPSEEGAPAVQMLLDDNQNRLDAAGDARYTRRVFRILKPEGLTAIKSASVIWSPDSDTVTLHTLRIIRGDRTIDLLGAGKDVLVLRRETSLEQASLDGRLTASRQIDGLQTGDIVDFAYTLVRADPVVQGHSFAAEQIGFAGVAGRYRAVISWPRDKAVQWKATAGFDAPSISQKGGRTVLTLDKTNVLAPKPPIGAPLRFRRVGGVEASSFQSWQDVSKLMAPLFAKAAEIPKGSPIEAEADAIAARHAKPEDRAFAALQLVEEKTRYFALLMGDGGYVPAKAEETWERRFGDCKAKTALLLAILHRLGIDAEPVLVNLAAGDGIDELPPALATFNHVIVRVRIGDRSYWLDGTRVGDTNPQAMKPPNHKWGLPLRAEGAGLEKIVEPPINVPSQETVLRLDASKGVDEKATGHVTITWSGIYATTMRATLARSSRADFERLWRQQFSNLAGGFDIDNVGWRDDRERDTFTLQLDGEIDMIWHRNQDLGAREYRVGLSDGLRLFPRREPGPNRDAPFAVPFPAFTRSRTEIVLPDGGKGYSVRGLSGKEFIGGREIVRTAEIKGPVASFTVEQRSVAPEVSYAEAQAANATIRRERDEDTLVRGPADAALKGCAAAASTPSCGPATAR